MGAKQSLEILEKVGEIATLAGIKGEVDDEAMHFAMGFDLGEGRSQMVFVEDTSRGNEHPVVTIFSPCLVLRKGMFGGVSKKMALELLRANEVIHFARYGIIESESQSMIVASIDHLLDNLDPQEFEAAVYSVAFAADSYERRFGKDVF